MPFRLRVVARLPLPLRLPRRGKLRAMGIVRPRKVLLPPSLCAWPSPKTSGTFLVTR